MGRVFNKKESEDNESKGGNYMICCNTITRRRPENVALNNERGAAVFCINTSRGAQGTYRLTCQIGADNAQKPRVTGRTRLS